MKKKKLLLIIWIFLVQITFAQTSQTIANLTAFAKTYGYVKYFHPSDEAHQLDWSEFSAYGAKEVESCKNNEELVETLNKIFSPIAPTSKFVLKEDKSKFDIQVLIPKDTLGFKTIYWQHEGVSFNMRSDGVEGNPFISVRVNKDEKLDKSAKYGIVSTKIDPDKIWGKEFKFEGWIKVKANNEGRGRFLVKVKKDDNELGFYNDSKDNPATKVIWDKFEIKGRIDTNAKEIVIGCFLMGKGTLYVDDIKFYYNEGGNWKELLIKNSDFETEELLNFKDSIPNWKRKGIGYDLNIQEEEKFTGKKAVKIEYVGEFEIKNGNPLFKCRLQIGEIIEKEIIPDVICQIPMVLYGDSNGTYPIADQTKLKLLNDSLKLTNNDPTDLYVRLGNIINIYNVFNHFYPYFDVVDVNWDKEFKNALKQSYNDKDGKDHLATLQRFTSKLKDGHVMVLSSLNELFMPPILWEWVEGKLMITFVMDKNLHINIGDIVEQIENKPPKEYFKSVEEKIAASTDGFLNYRAGYKSLYGPKGSVLKIQIDSREYKLTRDYYRHQVLESEPILPVKYKFIEDGIVYLNLDLIEMDSINELLPKLEKAKAIICDLRGYPNGNSDFISYLLKDNDTDSTWMQVPQIVYPDYENICSFNKSGWLIEAKEPYLGDKKIVFITDGQAISYAESFMSFIEGYNLATIVGQPTAGTNGIANSFDILGGYRIYWTGMRVVKHDGSQHHGIGILPDIEVNKTIQGVKEGRDEFLEKAIEIVK